MADRFICPPDHPHGENGTCRSVHSCKCDDCRERGRLYEYWRAGQHRAGRDLLISPLGTVRRIQALQALGWSHEAISAAAGHTAAWSALICRRPRIKPATAMAVARVYEDLSMRVPSASGMVTRTRKNALRKGWAPPLAWDDIDDPAETPHGQETYETDTKDLNERTAA